LRRGSILGTVLKLAISLGLMAWLIGRYGGDPGFRETLVRLDWRAFLLAEGVVALGLAVSALRWKVLLRAAGVTLGWGRAIRLYFAGYFFNFFLPTTVGGDVVRAMGAGGRTPLSVLGGSILVERILGFGCLLVIGLAASFSLAGLAAARAVLGISAAVYLVGLAVLLFVPLPESERAGRVGRVLAGLRRTALQVRAYGFHGAAIAGATALSLTWQLALVGANWILAAGLGGVAPGESLLALVPVVQAVSMIPVSFGGLGVREMGYEYFFSASGFDPAGAVALGVAWLGVTVALALKGGIVWMVRPVREREE
jgi:uncharacterized membrane protein YbhN (UPF0104 family)